MNEAILVRPALLAALLISQGAMAETTAPSGHPKVFAVVQSVYAAPVWIAQANGYFAAEGLKVAIKPCSSRHTCLKQLLEERAHFATAADTPVAVASFSHADLPS